MVINTFEKNGYMVIEVSDDLTRETDFGNIVDIVRDYLNGGNHNIALLFTERSYFYSSSISGLVQCLGLIKEREGRLAIIQPNEGILDTLRIVGMGKLIDIYSSVDELGS